MWTHHHCPAWSHLPMEPPTHHHRSLPVPWHLRLRAPILSTRLQSTPNSDHCGCLAASSNDLQTLHT